LNGKNAGQSARLVRDKRRKGGGKGKPEGNLYQRPFRSRLKPVAGIKGLKKKRGEKIWIEPGGMQIQGNRERD